MTDSFFGQLSGSFVSNVSNTVSTVSAKINDSAIMAGRGNQNYNMTIKCTPSKDAVTSTDLAIKSGYLMQKTEQGDWQNRFVCTVPHTFLYLYDSAEAESPLGVLDLELFSNISREAAVVSVSTFNDELSTYYFESDDYEYLDEWISSLSRDRFHTVKEEGNAYQQMQLEMTGVLNAGATREVDLQSEKASLEQELQSCSKKLNEAVSVMQDVLLVLGITEDEMAEVTKDYKKMGQRLNSGILNLKRDIEAAQIEGKRALEFAINKEQEQANTSMEALRSQLDAESQARRVSEQQLLKAKEDVEARIRTLIVQVDNANLNTQMAITAKGEVDTKNYTLSEQKKVLIKEVKQLRKKMEETLESSSNLQAVNDKLCKVVAGYQTAERIVKLPTSPAAEGESQTSDSDLVNQLGSTGSSNGSGSRSRGGGYTGDGGITGDNRSSSGHSIGEVEEGSNSNMNYGEPPDEQRDSRTSRDTIGTLEYAVEGLSDSAVFEYDGLPALSGEGPEGVEGEGRIQPLEGAAWRMLLEIEEEDCISKSFSNPGDGSVESSNGRRRFPVASAIGGAVSAAAVSSGPLLQSSKESLVKGVGTISTTSGAAVSSVVSAASRIGTGSQEDAVEEEDDGPAIPDQAHFNEPALHYLMEDFDSMLSTAGGNGGNEQDARKDPSMDPIQVMRIQAAEARVKKEKAREARDSAAALSTSRTAAAASTSSSTKPAATAATVDDDSDDGVNADAKPSSMTLLCHRCQGTVAGPKNSTCRCAVPALNPEDAVDSVKPSTWQRPSIKFLKNGITGGLVGGIGGIQKATTAVRNQSVTGIKTLGSVGAKVISSNPLNADPPIGGNTPSKATNAFATQSNTVVPLIDLDYDDADDDDYGDDGRR